jgi:hypothetical protein
MNKKGRAVTGAGRLGIPEEKAGGDGQKSKRQEKWLNKAPCPIEQGACPLHLRRWAWEGSGDE